jgi:DNA-binding GntR family transcriptional regulator
MAGWLARAAHPVRVVRLAAELGDDTARRRLQAWLSRLRERADAGDEHTREFLAENPDWRQFRLDWA